MRLPQAAERRWMSAVAIVAIVVVTGMLIQRSRSYASLASFHAEAEKECWRMLEASEGRQLDPEDRKDWIAHTRGVLRYHARMARNYRRAARYPWLPLEPDPPNPGR
jgi:hypothetical protein